MDAAGRPAFQHLRDDLFQLYDWTGEICDVLEFNGAPRKLERFMFADGKLVEEVSTEGGERLDGRPPVDVTRWSYENDRPVLALTTYESHSHDSWGGPERGAYWGAKAHTFTYDADGELSAITTWIASREFADGAGVDDAQTAARNAFPQDFDPRPLYNARTQRRETVLPAPDRAYQGLAEPLSHEIFAAIERERGALGPLECVLVFVNGTESRAIAADSTFLDRATRMTRGLRELLIVAFDGPRGTLSLDVADVASPDVLRGLRAGEQALAESGSYRHEAFQREVVAALNACDWRGVESTFVVLSLPADEHDSGHWSGYADEEPPRRSALPDLEPIIGPERVDAFLARLAERPRRRRPRRDLRPQSQAELADLLVDAGLTPAEAGLVADDAQWAIVLEPGGTGVTRLGGAPVLPAGTPWPHADGRPLTHLATIALDELPAVEGREHLPDDGFLSFFADTSDEGGFLEPIEPADETGHDLAVVVHSPAGAPTHEPDPPGERLAERRAAPIGRLQLRHLGFGSGERRFAIDALAEKAVERLTERVNGRTRHQLLGHPWPVQDDPREPGQIVLFHIAEDPGLGFSFIDAGDIHFLGTPEDIKRGRWDMLTIVPSSC